MSDRQTSSPGITAGGVRVDAGHGAGPVIRFPWTDRFPPQYRVWAVKDAGAEIYLSVLDATPDRDAAVESAAAWRGRPDLGGDVTGVVVSGPAGERVPTFEEGE